MHEALTHRPEDVSGTVRDASGAAYIKTRGALAQPISAPQSGTMGARRRDRRRGSGGDQNCGVYQYILRQCDAHPKKPSTFSVSPVQRCVDGRRKPRSQRGPYTPLPSSVEALRDHSCSSSTVSGFRCWHIRWGAHVPPGEPWALWGPFSECLESPEPPSKSDDETILLICF